MNYIKPRELTEEPLSIKRNQNCKISSIKSVKENQRNEQNLHKSLIPFTKANCMGFIKWHARTDIKVLIDSKKMVWLEENWQFIDHVSAENQAMVISLHTLLESYQYSGSWLWMLCVIIPHKNKPSTKRWKQIQMSNKNYKHQTLLVFLNSINKWKKTTLKLIHKLIGFQ